jgi:tRNA nucleotidyltransferase (CCA-adding enzyme)
MAATAWSSVSDYVNSLGLDAYLVGGAVRDQLLGKPAKDEDFVVPGVGHAELRAALEPHGRVEDLEVGGQLVGVRLYPRDRGARSLAPGGIEFAPPRTERSTGPGRHDFEIVADASIPLEDDMRRRDFTINAIARRVATRELLDPLGGAADLERGTLRTVARTSFRDDPLRLVRGLRFVSQLDVEPDDDTLRQMREEAHRIRIVSGERIGGGLTADGMGELSKLLLGARPGRALRLARDTGVLVHLLPEYEAALGYAQESPYHALTLDEHHFEAVQAAADAGFPLEVRLALLLHDLGKPEAAWRGEDGRLHFSADPALGRRGHAEIGAGIASAVLARLRYPTRLQSHVRRLVRAHAFIPPADDLPREARRFLARHRERLALHLVAHKEADLRAQGLDVEEDLARLAAFRRALGRERSSPHRIRDLAVDGHDLIALGYEPGPQLGQALEHLLGYVVDQPGRNVRELLLANARRMLEEQEATPR